MSKNVIIAVVVVAIVAVAAGFFLMNANKSNQSPNSVADTMTEKVNESSPNANSATRSAMEVGSVKTFAIEGSPFKYSPNNISVNQGDKVRVVFKNVTGQHDFVIDEYDVKTNVLAAGAEETVEFIADKKGSFEFYCSVGNHRQMGMVGTLVVN